MWVGAWVGGERWVDGRRGEGVDGQRVRWAGDRQI